MSEPRPPLLSPFRRRGLPRFRCLGGAGLSYDPHAETQPLVYLHGVMRQSVFDQTAHKSVCPGLCGVRSIPVFIQNLHGPPAMGFGSRKDSRREGGNHCSGKNRMENTWQYLITKH